MEEFDVARLEKHDGKDGRSAYVAVDQRIYDLSSSERWKDGTHMGRHDAGRDLTEALANAPHGREVLDPFEEVGLLKTRMTPTEPPRAAWVSKLLGLHLHPISVHFPQALLTLAPFFLILFYLTGNVHFERTCFYLAVAGWLASFPAVLTGLFHWVYKYGRSLKGLYIFKLSVSGLLFVYAPVVVYTHSTKGPLAAEPLDALMIVLYLLLIPLTAAAGHAGGKIVFG